MAATPTLPQLPIRHRDLLSWIQTHPNTPLHQIITPYNEYDAAARRLFAQEPSHDALQDNHLNIVPVYDSNGTCDVRVRARDPASESAETNERYIMPLNKEKRRPSGTPAVVPKFEDFWKNFNIFSEGALSDMDWSNVVVAGSAVVTCLLPVPEEYRNSKRGLRKYYHETIAPASDVDLFLYGLDEAQAIEKIQQIEDKVKNSILYETTTVRTKNAITIVSQYPTRHVQIVLRIYKSIAEILTGFDVDCSCAAFDGKQVFVSPRALASYITQINTVDLSRRSPSYENRLSKYSHRGFEIFWPQLNRSQIDPTIFERSFTRTVGLARLLVLEKLPKSSDRESYIEQRREERGRPAPRYNSRRMQPGNIKDDWIDEVPEWEEGEEVSDYNTFTIPYGPRFKARKIEKLVYTRDMVLNAEWNKPKDRQVNLHRHPAFVGDAVDVVQDCCGCCPQPETPEDKEVAEKESKVYVSGNVSFMKDDPGRQEIGSFNPITETDWTEMAYVGNTERLCHAIVDCDLETVQECLAGDNADPNNRDYTGRAPLHLAASTSSPEIVQCLVDHGARLISRVADGRTALHLAAARGSVEIVRILLRKSEQNEADQNPISESTDEGETDIDEEEDVSTSEDQNSCTSGSFVKVGREIDSKGGDIEDENEKEPDIYDINVVSWDIPTSALHLAILHGHVDVVNELVASFGADVLLPIKFVGAHRHSSRVAILNLALALRLPPQKAIAMTEKLLQLGALPTQADLSSLTPLHYVAASEYTDLLDIYLEQSLPATQKAINYLAPKGYSWTPNVFTVLMAALHGRNSDMAIKLLKAGAKPSIDFDSFVKPGQGVYERIRSNTSERNWEIFRCGITQPIVRAVQRDLPLVALSLIEYGADPNTLTTEGYKVLSNESAQASSYGKSLLDCVRDKIKELRRYHGERAPVTRPTPLVQADDCLDGLSPGTYQMWTAERALHEAKALYEESQKSYVKTVHDTKNRKGVQNKISAIQALVDDFKRLEATLLEKGAMSFYHMHPDCKKPSQEGRNSVSDTTKSEPFKVKFDFTVPDLTDTKREAYLTLFEAAWRGDLDTIKALTLAAGDGDDDQTPLQIAVRDQNRFSPFSIAVLRGHRIVAKAILEIVQAQFKIDESETSERFEVDMEALHDDDVDVGIYSEIIDDKFTLENIGETATQVECRISPLEVFSWDCPAHVFITNESKTSANDLVEYAVQENHVDLLEFLLRLGQELTERDTRTRIKGQVYTVPTSMVWLAMTKGHLECLGALIKHTGADFPTENLLLKNGIETEKEKPRYYQGLFIRGKRRAEWANHGGGGWASSSSDQVSPLLVAASKGSLRSVEWFFSLAPLQHYIEFVKTHEHNERLRLLAQSDKGVEAPVMDWLQSGSDLALHCAILSEPTEESCRLVEYLVQRSPQHIETKSSQGCTPLALAFSLHRVDFARILINAGANQTTRDRKGNNLIHLLLCDINCQAREEPDNMESLLNLLDPRLASSLLIERSSDGPGSATPIARWMEYVKLRWSRKDRPSGWRFDLRRETKGKLAIIRHLLTFAEPTDQKHLDVLDGAGSTPVHEAVKKQLPQTFKLMLNYRPDLLYRENATGSTPLELAVDKWTAEATFNPPPSLIDGKSSEEEVRNEVRDVLRRWPESFEPDYPAKSQSERHQIYTAACEGVVERPHKRKLVSLNEANEVARRLAARGERGDSPSSSPDVVAQWYFMAN
ncbi:ankyrin repeat protein [Aspergillus heteromorphus CBS 117.55]|uniref:Ankyrin repeat protein n=1 Tax=Aspergillus heteromorphus CBS 117.55 TaxID=1448321 RepID=A0A317VVS0_9EURO|nr:ankyrin repeat protein [Aspergillus heteromorphus CBS 117.55]PWY77072.1 ankyrin repeat protein [Aspergillus heteromorphus CBS 117.55]